MSAAGFHRSMDNVRDGLSCYHFFLLYRTVHVLQRHHNHSAAAASWVVCGFVMCSKVNELESCITSNGPGG